MCYAGQPLSFCRLENMKKIKVKIINTRDREGSLPAGAVLNMPELTARVWIKQGLAIEVPGDITKHEYAVRQATENAMLGE